MKIGGFQKFTLTDFPGRIAAIVFTQGCNFRCPFCHNGDLIPNDGDLIPNDEVLDFLKLRSDKLQGVVITGGEPLLQIDLEGFVRDIKSFGLDVKLDTNGSMPEALQHLITNKLLDYIAMDIKAPLGSYKKLSGVAITPDKIQESMTMIAGSGIEHEFRTTVVPPLLSHEDIITIKAQVPKGSKHRLQKFCPDNALDATLGQYINSKEEYYVNTP